MSLCVQEILEVVSYIFQTWTFVCHEFISTSDIDIHFDLVHMSTVTVQVMWSYFGHPNLFHTVDKWKPGPMLSGDVCSPG